MGEVTRRASAQVDSVDFRSPPDAALEAPSSAELERRNGANVATVGAQGTVGRCERDRGVSDLKRNADRDLIAASP